jgi:hypothetical protein
MRVGLTLSLRKDPGFRSEYDPREAYRDALIFEVEAESVDDALNIAYAVGNSSYGPFEDVTFAQAVRYREAVKVYRDAKNRSLSVGDLILVNYVEDVHGEGDGETLDLQEVYLVARFGFDLVGSALDRVVLPPLRA